MELNEEGRRKNRERAEREGDIETGWSRESRISGVYFADVRFMGTWPL